MNPAPARLAALAPVGPQLGQQESLGFAANPVADTPNATDVQEFQRAMNQFSSHAPGTVGAAAQMKPVDSPQFEKLSNYLSKRSERMADLFDGTVRHIGDNRYLLKAVMATEEASLENEMLAKVVGKTFSGIEQLTKLN